MTARLSVRVEGQGRPLLLVHGSAADSSTWTIQLASLRSRARMIVPERRGTPGSPVPTDAAIRVGEHAEDLAGVIEEHAEEPLVAIGSSFGGVCVLELARRRPELLRGMVLCEPPLPAADTVPPMPPGFGCEMDRLIATEGGPAAGAFFLRQVLGDEAFERMPVAWRERACGLWRQIRMDTAALVHYRIGYDTLEAVEVPALLLGGERSDPYFRPTLEALAQALPDAELRILPGAGHMLHADAHRAFARHVLGFAT